MKNAMAMNKEVNVLCYKKILSVLLEKELGEISIKAQSMIQGDDTDLRGIRLDVEINEKDKESEVETVYDYEPHTKNDLDFPRHSRFYQAKVDGRYVRSGLRDFSKIPNLFVITITNFDIFGENQMIYTFRNKCKEIPELEYNDGLTFLYFNTKGAKGGSESIHNMLKYIESTREENEVDAATKEIAEYVKRVKRAPEVEAGFMTLGDRMDLDNAKAREEGREEGIEVGREEERWSLLMSMVAKGKILVEDAAEEIGISVEEFQKKMSSM